MQLNFKKMGKGQPFIILHGLFGSLDNWQSIARELASTFEVYLVDLRNHGDSFHHEDFSYDAMSKDLAIFLTTHTIENPIIMGHSMGGKVAMNFALKNPGHFDKLIVVDIAPKSYPVHHDRILEGLSALDVKNLTSRNEADQQLAEYVPQRAVRQFLLKNMGREKSGGFSWKINLEGIQENIGLVGDGIADNLRSDKQTLFIVGKKSDYIKEEDISGIRAIFANSKIEWIEGAGHWVHAEQPQQFLAVVNAFLDGASSKPAEQVK